MIIGIGTDLCEIARFEALSRRRPGVLERLFTPEESSQDGTQRRIESMAARFAAKEALAKALGAPAGLVWHDARVLADERGRPHFELSGTVAQAAQRLGVNRVHLSLSHDAGVAIAYVVCEG